MLDSHLDCAQSDHELFWGPGYTSWSERGRRIIDMAHIGRRQHLSHAGHDSELGRSPPKPERESARTDWYPPYMDLVVSPPPSIHSTAYKR